MNVNDERSNRHFAGILAGPTASGKSDLAVRIARQANLAIVSADSMQCYRGLEVGTGALSCAEQQGVPHYLLGVAEPGEEFHAARFVAEARAAAAHEWKLHRRRTLVVGGTGMWIQALREGLFEGPGRDERVRQELRQQLASEGLLAFHERLRAVDPALAALLSPRDHVRVLRALEVYHLTGRPLSAWQEEDGRRRAALSSLLPLLVIDRPREELYQRINARVVAMLAGGWLDEARLLRSLGLPDHAPARKALGYRTLFQVLDGAVSLEAATAQIQQETRQFAKRQLTWFRGQRDAVFLTEPTVEQVLALLWLTPDAGLDGGRDADSGN